jgi:hypothetical protein
VVDPADVLAPDQKGWLPISRCRRSAYRPGVVGPSASLARNGSQRVRQDSNASRCGR